jgi:hypothetical protein
MVSGFGADSTPGNGPQTVRGASRPLDVELVVQWAIARSGRLPWDRARDRELAFDQGLSARPRRRPPTSWALASACAGIRLEGRPTPAIMQPGPDAELVIEAIKALEGGAAEIVIACARGRCRPDWFEGVEPRQVERPRKHQRGANCGHHGSTWSPCSPAQIRAARDRYRCWHAALGRLASVLAGRLEAWEINGPAAPAEPWEGRAETTS